MVLIKRHFSSGNSEKVDISTGAFIDEEDRYTSYELSYVLE
jgi:hypothetical protein